MSITVDPRHGNHQEPTGRNRPRRQHAWSRLTRVGFTLAVVAPAILWAEPAAARIAVNHNESVGKDHRA